MTDLLRKDSFKWTDEAEMAFMALKTAMTTTPVLRLPDFTLPFIVESDASNIRVGAVLMQEGQPVAYYSKKMGARM